MTTIEYVFCIGSARSTWKSPREVCETRITILGLKENYLQLKNYLFLKQPSLNVHTNHNNTTVVLVPRNVRCPL
jgi:hypothetical protein